MKATRSTRKNQSRRQRLIAKYNEHNGACHWCGLPMVIGGNPHSDLFATYDHLDERGIGKPMGRYVAAHRVCNNRRHHDPTPEPSALVAVTEALDALKRKDAVKRC